MNDLPQNISDYLIDLVFDANSSLRREALNTLLEVRSAEQVITYMEKIANRAIKQDAPDIFGTALEKMIDKYKSSKTSILHIDFWTDIRKRLKNKEESYWVYYLDALENVYPQETITSLRREEDVPMIERENQIAFAIERIDDMNQGRIVPDCVLFYYGVATIGKTTILRQIAQYAEKKGTTSAWIDFDRSGLRKGDRANWYDGTIGRIHAIERLLHDLSKTADLALGDVAVSDLLPNQADLAAEHLLKFAQAVYRARQQKPFVLFFDTVEDSDLDTFIWLQEHILEDFVNEFRALIVIAGRRHPNKIERDLIYPLERRTVKIRLEPFDAEQTEQQIRAIGAKELYGIGDELKLFTNGLPGLNDAAVRRLVQEKQRRPDANLRRYLVAELLFEKRLTHVDDDPKLKQQLLAVAPLRQFDAGLLRAIASTLFDAAYSSSSIGALRNLIQKLQKTRLIEPHPDGYGYVMPQHIRPMLDNYLQQQNLVEHFNVHRIAADYFNQQVKGKDWVMIANRLYHLGGLQRDLEAAPPDMRVRLMERLDDDLRSRPIDFQRMSAELRNTLDRISESNQPGRVFDLTIKIQRVLEEVEFKEIMELETVDRLIRICADYSDDSSLRDLSG
jgi:hypothetical protein